MKKIKAIEYFVFLITLSLILYSFGLLIDYINPYTPEMIKIVLIPIFLIIATVVPFTMSSWLVTLLTKVRKQ